MIETMIASNVGALVGFMLWRVIGRVELEKAVPRAILGALRERRVLGIPSAHQFSLLEA